VLNGRRPIWLAELQHREYIKRRTLQGCFWAWTKQTTLLA